MGNLTTMLEGPAQAWIAAMLNSAWQGVVVAVCVALVLGRWPRSNATTRFAVWGATLGVVALLPFFNLGAPRLASSEAWGDLAKILLQAGEIVVEPEPAVEAATGRPAGAGVVELMHSGRLSLPWPEGGWAVLTLAAWLVAGLRLLVRLGAGCLGTVALRRGTSIVSICWRRA